MVSTCRLYSSFPDIPSSTLTLGSNLNGSNIKEGDDVYFECAVKASPRPYKITWKHNVSIVSPVATKHSKRG